MYGRNITKSEDKARQRNVYVKKHLKDEMDVQKELERVHLTAIRHEKIKLQKELERMRNKGQFMVKRQGMSNHTKRLLKLRFANNEQKDQDANNIIQEIIEEQENQRRAGLGLPEIGGSKRIKSTGNDNMTMEQRVILHRRKEAEKLQNSLVARVGQLTDEFKTKTGQQAPLPSRRRSVSPIRRDMLSVKPDSAMTAKSDGYNEEIRRKSRAKLNRLSITEIDLNEARNSVSRRLLKSDSQVNTPEDDTRRRKVSHVLPIEGDKKTSPVGTPTATRDTPPQMSSPQKSPMPQTAEELVFDQDTYAPDGHVRTVHLLPSSEEAFEEAKKARYIRWRGQGPEGEELFIDKIFTKGEDEKQVENESDDEETGVDTHEDMNLGLLKS